MGEHRKGGAWPPHSKLRSADGIKTQWPFLLRVDQEGRALPYRSFLAGGEAVRWRTPFYEMASAERLWCSNGGGWLRFEETLGGFQGGGVDFH
jgi:hypothetical protein